MAVQTIESLSERLGQLEARPVQIDEDQRELRGSTDDEDRRQCACLILEGEDIKTELSQLCSAAALKR